jgi:hypothetical protein
MSSLEKLPAELLVEIFINCMNLNLPRSSPVIGGKLTSGIVYIRAINEAFSSTWSEGYGHYRRGSPSFHNEIYPLTEFPTQAAIQEQDLQVSNLHN